MEPKIRKSVYLSTQANDKVIEAAGKLGLSQNVVINLAIMTGLDALLMASNPDMRVYFEKMITSGRAVTLPDGSIMGSEEL